MTLKADTLTLDVPTDSYQAKGKVRVVRNGATLLADSVIYRRLTGDMLAEGNIFLEQAADTLKGDRFSLNLPSRQGELLNGELFIKKTNFRLYGKRVEKTGDEDYHVERGSFTTCDGDNPSWHFEARDLQVTLDEFATGRDAVFYIGKVPMFYTPYILFPAATERQSGLLLPKLGNSTKKGIYYDQPFYWAATPSQDLTADLDLESARGAGVGIDYRYLRKGGSEGELQSYGIYDTQMEKFRGEFNLRQLELLTPATTLSADIHLIADRSYFRDFSENSGEYNRQLLGSNLAIDHRWERYALTGQLNYIEDLVAADNDATLQRLPALNFVAAGTKAGPLFFSMDAGLINFNRVQGANGERLDLHPRVSLYQKPLEILDFSIYGGYEQRLYNAYGAQVPGGVRSIGNLDAGSTLALPLERIYDGQLRHLLTPALEYGYVQTKRDDDLPFFDYGDRVLGQNVLKWSLASTFTRKYQVEGGIPDYRDLLFLKLSQGYQFSGERRDLLTLVDHGHRLTDLMLESKLSPAKGVALALDGRYNPIDNNLSTANLALEYKGEGTNFATLGYRYSRETLDYLEGHFAFPVSSRLSASVLARYSFDKNGFLESRYSLEYKRQCWSIITSYSDRSGNRSFTVNFALAGIGPLAPIRAF